MKSLLPFLAIVGLLCISVSPMLRPLTAHALGDAKFLLTRGTLDLRRTTDTEVVSSARFQVSEDGAPDEEIGFVTINLSLAKVSTNGVFERWKVNKITFTNGNFKPYTRGGQTLPNKSTANGSVLTLYNDDQQLVKRFDYSSSVPNYGYVIINQKAITSINADYPGIYVKDVGSGNESIIPYDRITQNELSPISAMAQTYKFAGSIASVGEIAGQTFVPYSPVFNYDLNPENSSIDAVSKEQAEGWYAGQNLGKLMIQRFEEQNKPPFVDIAAHSGLRRPKIRFVLSHMGAEGSGWFLWDNMTWAVFTAHRVDSNGQESSSVSSNLYLLVNDNGDASIAYDEDRLGIEKGKFEPIVDVNIPDDNINQFYGYAYTHVPQNTQQENCGEELTYTIGPSGADYRHYTNIPGRPDPASELNGNCLADSPVGWPVYWGVTVNSVPSNALGDGGCSLNWIINGGIAGQLAGAGKDSPPSIITDLDIDESQLTNPMARIAVCMYQWLVDPLVKWGADLITNVGGVAYKHAPEYKFESIIYYDA